MSAHDLSRVVNTLDGEAIPAKRVGADFVSITSGPSFEDQEDLVGGHQTSRQLTKTIVATYTVGQYSEAHRLLGAKHIEQEATLEAGEVFAGWDWEYSNPGNGDTMGAQNMRIRESPDMAASQNAGTYTWVLSGERTFRRFGESIPVGGGDA